MKRLLALLICVASAHAQNGWPVSQVPNAGALPVSCTGGIGYILVSTGLFYTCQGGVPVIFGGIPTVAITTGASATLGASFTYNQNATAATAITYTLPTASAGAQYCVDNSYNGSAPTTGVLTVATSASGQFIVFSDGTLTASGGNVVSAGAARDGACFVGIDATHWMFYPHSASGVVWTKN